MISRVPGVRTMSEPWAIVGVNYLCQTGQMSMEESVQLVQSVLRVQCKVEPDADVDQIFIKFSGCNSVQCKIISDLFPQMHQVYSTRHPKNNIISLTKIFSQTKRGLYGWLPHGHRFFLNLFPHPYEKVEKFLKYKERMMAWPSPLFPGEIGAMHYVVALHHYLKHKNLFKAVILYEDLVENPEREMKKLYKLMALSEKYLKESIEATKIDSQLGVLCQRGHTDEWDHCHAWTKVNDLFSYFDLPMIKHDMPLDDFRRILIDQ
jgi:hypothetical protein